MMKITSQLAHVAYVHPPPSKTDVSITILVKIFELRNNIDSVFFTSNKFYFNKFLVVLQLL